MADLYRKSSLDKLSNPEQLDRMIKISSPLSWLALIAVLLIIVATLVWSIAGTLPTTETVNGMVVDVNSVHAIYANAAGTFNGYSKDIGDTVAQGDEIAEITLADGTEKTITADCDGVLSVQSFVAEDESAAVFAGTEIARITPANIGSQVVVCYIQLSSAQKFEKGQEVLVYPTSVDSQKYGHMVAEIVSVEEYATNRNSLMYVLGSDNMIADQFIGNGPIVAVVCRLKTDVSSKSGFYWSGESGKDLTISNDTMISAKIKVAEEKPISKLFGKFKDNAEG
ncbi:MAG: hypothetical protein E7523_04125 [Ruminococcaceae bacterium]|nr:hypothetical protein [Oscillospiraceae bacterium]